MQFRKILVTGNAGFIGMHVFIKLSEEGYELTGIDNINDYYDVNLKVSRLRAQGFQYDASNGEPLKNTTNNNLFYKGNIQDKELINKVFEENDFDCVIHLAAQAGVRYSLQNPDQYIQSNICG